MDKKIPVHSRDISIHIFSIDDGTLLAEGSLRDNRKLPSYSTAGGRYIDPGDIHHIVVRLYVSVPDNVIARAEADMVAVPGGGICLEIKDSIKNLVGISVRQGFAKKVLDIMGGVKGCLHMTNLVIAMGSAIVQGQYLRAEKNSPDTDMPEVDTSVLKNSCWLWRENGPHIEKLKS
ncbi:MAG: DUF2889 domain-containing protein [Deltaproteobacteria bacterium]|nr:DUF2889 domain-containing protein [Deltaproteobacteria bacterium]